jgi:hypothetical protein
LSADDGHSNLRQRAQPPQLLVHSRNDEATGLLKQLAARLHTDTSVAEIGRVLRIPGFYNRKRNSKKGRDGTPFLVRIVEHDDSRRYTLAEMHTAYPPIEGESAPRNAEWPFPFDEEECTPAAQALCTEVAEWLNKRKHDFERTGPTRLRLAKCPTDKRHVDAQLVARNNGSLWVSCFHSSCGANKRDLFPDLVKGVGGWKRDMVFLNVNHSITVDAALASLAKSADIYARGGQLVRVLSEPTPVIASIPLPALFELSSRVSDWRKYTKKTGWTSIHPTAWAITEIAARGEWPMLRKLKAIVSAPTLRADGTVLDKTGYDEKSGLYYTPSIDFPPAKDAPTQADAAAALQRLIDVVKDFAWQSEASKSAWLAALLTPIARHAYEGPTPLMVIESSTRGSGKTLLADVISVIIAGAPFAKKTYTDDAELEKKLDAVAVSGEPITLFDNIRSLSGSPLDMVATATERTVRIFGQNNTMWRGPWQTIVYLTGNNPGIYGDTVRRVLPILLAPDDERPEERTDFAEPKLLLHVREQRSTLYMAALTALQAYFSAGKPAVPAATHWGSYEGWCDVVRNAIIWAGRKDPALTRDEMIEDEPEVDAINELFNNLAGAREHLGTGWTCSDLVEAMLDNPTLGRLRSAFETLIPRLRRSPTARDVAYVLRNLKNRVVNGRRLVYGGKAHNNVAVWKLVDVKKSA